MNNSLTKPFIYVILATGISACSNEEASLEPVIQERLVKGECGTVFDGEICTWSKMLGDELVAFGASVSLSSAENADLEAEFIFPPTFAARLPMPEGVKSHTGIDHLGINWESHGHPPGPFFTPHFDFHFFTVSTDEVDAIDCSDVSKPETLPAGYALPDIELPGLGMLVGLCVPQMGMHALSEEEMAATDLFGASMVVGFYAQQPIFIEPMISRDLLMVRENFSLAIPDSSAPAGSAAWPDSFEATYDARADAYHMTFSLQN
ncbi:MAG: hypothetical protein ACI9H8_000932 [Lysobacterales bacterium]|jgi:hypothetical protein